MFFFCGSKTLHDFTSFFFIIFRKTQYQKESRGVIAENNEEADGVQLEYMPASPNLPIRQGKKTKSASKS